jgi:hypothetical protein
MSALIVDGKALALSLEEGLRERVGSLKERGVISGDYHCKMRDHTSFFETPYSLA